MFRRRLIALPGVPVEFAETEVTVGDEGSKPRSFRLPAGIPRAGRQRAVALSSVYRTFWFERKKLSGSQVFLIAASFS